MQGVVEDLVGFDDVPAGGGDQLGEVNGVEVADAPMADLARSAELREGLDRLVEWQLASPVQQVDVKPVGPQALEASLTRLDRSVSRRVRRQNLADEEDFVAPALDRLGDQFPAAPSPYISAVSIGVRPSSSPSRSERTSSPRSRGFSPISQVPWPSTGICSPDGRRTEGMLTVAKVGA
jgi:hypothetical protein